MGTAVILDVLGSMVIGGILLLILFRLNDSTTQNTYNFSGELVVQQNMVTTVEVLEYDFRKIGYCKDPLAIPDPEVNAIQYADTSDIKFLTDVLVTPYNDPDPEGDGIVDTMEYCLGPKITSTPNPNDRMLYRIVNGDTTGVNLGITEFRIRYFRDSAMVSGGTTLAEIYDLPRYAPTQITAMQIDIQVENSAAYNAGKNPYRYAFWRQIRLSSRNLNR